MSLVSSSKQIVGSIESLANSQVNLHKYRRLINESKIRVKNLLGKSSAQDSSALNVVFNKETNSTNIQKSGLGKKTGYSECYGESDQFEQCLDSMAKLAQFVLYDTSGDLKCLFNLSECDKKDIDYYAKEIDAIQEELSDINDRIGQIRCSYKSYNEDFLRLCDEKDVLFELFLDYYEEYFLEEEKPALKEIGDATHDGRNNRNRKKSTSNNSAAKKTSRRKSSRSVSVSRRQASASRPKPPETIKDRKPVNEEDNDVLGAIEGNRNDKRMQLRRRSSIYIYSVPTENRFSILSKTEDGSTRLKHY